MTAILHNFSKHHSNTYHLKIQKFNENQYLMWKYLLNICFTWTIFYFVTLHAVNPTMPPHDLIKAQTKIVTARIRRMGQANIVSLFVRPRRGGVRGRGIPQSLVQGPFSSLWRGYPGLWSQTPPRPLLQPLIPGPFWGGGVTVPSLWFQVRVSHLPWPGPWLKGGVGQGAGVGTPVKSQVRVPLSPPLPQIEHAMDKIRCMRYAAGRLSCWLIFSKC